MIYLVKGFVYYCRNVYIMLGFVLMVLDFISEFVVFLMINGWFFFFILFICILECLKVDSLIYMEWYIWRVIIILFSVDCLFVVGYSEKC